jgi:hypothetical protein
MTEFPKWKYHDTEAACIVDTAEAEAALGADWRDTPDNRDIPEDEPADELANCVPRLRPRASRWTHAGA